MGNISKILSRLLDYLWFWSILLFAADILDLDILYYLIITLALPLLFVPIETFLIKCFKTTLGKFIFGLQYTETFTWKSAFLFSLKKALFLKTSSEVIQKKPKRLPHIIAITIATLFSLLSIFPDATLNQASKILPFECIQNLKIQRNGGVNCPDGWIKLGSQELPFSAFFPEEPKFEETKKPIPHSSTTLTYREYTHNEYSLGYVDLPSSWTKWGSHIVFKASLQQILIRDKGSVTQKKKTLHDSFPALDYQIKRGDNITSGRLVLVGNTLYKLEVSNSPSKETSEIFFNTFQLTNSPYADPIRE